LRSRHTTTVDLVDLVDRVDRVDRDGLDHDASVDTDGPRP